RGGLATRAGRRPCQAVGMSAQRFPGAARGRGARNVYAPSRGSAQARRARGGRRSRRPVGGASALVRMLIALAIIAALVAVVVSRVQHVVGNGGLPLSDASVIREQATDKHLD